MKKIICSMLVVVLTFTFIRAEIKEEVSQNLLNISVTIHSKNSQGSGVIKVRDGISFVWTAAHVVANSREVREVIDPRTGSPKHVVEFSDVKVVKEDIEGGRFVGKTELDAEVICYSDAAHGDDLALLKIRKKNFSKDSVNFYMEDKIPFIGSRLIHVGSLLGQLGSNSLTSGVMSKHGRVIDGKTFDQTTCAAFRGSCLPANTMISMADGTYKKIVDVKVGDKVISFNNHITVGTVENSMVSGVKEIFKISTKNKSLKASGNHPLVKVTHNVLTWIRADELEEGDDIVTVDNNERISSIEKLPAEMTYDLTVSPFHNFFANGILVKNSGGGIFLEKDGRCIGMIVRGAGETFNLIVPVRRMRDWAKKMNVEFAIDDNVPMPKNIKIEDIGGNSGVVPIMPSADK